jgi:hypothetical protein
MPKLYGIPRGQRKPKNRRKQRTPLAVELVKHRHYRHHRHRCRLSPTSGDKLTAPLDLPAGTPAGNWRKVMKDIFGATPACAVFTVSRSESQAVENSVVGYFDFFSE